MPKILIADDDAEMLSTLEQIFKLYQFEVLKAANGLEAVEIAEAQKPDIILLDGMMPVMDGFEAGRNLKTKPETRHIPLVYLTANYTDVDYRISGLEIGADDYILKPFNAKELVTRTRAILKRADMMNNLKVENEHLTTNARQMREKLGNLLELSQKASAENTFDPLTGLYNFQAFRDRLKEEFARAVRYNNALSLVLININHFDKMAEALGIQISNYVVMKVANLLLSKTRSSDILGRWQENRFCALLPQTNEQGGYFEAERLRVTLSNAEFMDNELLETANISRHKVSEYRELTVNLGAATYEGASAHIINEEDLFNKAWEALKLATSKGKNVTVSYNRVQVKQETE